MNSLVLKHLPSLVHELFFMVDENSSQLLWNVLRYWACCFGRIFLVLFLYLLPLLGFFSFFWLFIFRRRVFMKEEWILGKIILFREQSFRMRIKLYRGDRVFCWLFVLLSQWIRTLKAYRTEMDERLWHLLDILLLSLILRLSILAKLSWLFWVSLIDFYADFEFWKHLCSDCNQVYWLIISQFKFLVN